LSVVSGVLSFSLRTAEGIWKTWSGYQPATSGTTANGWQTCKRGFSVARHLNAEQTALPLNSYGISQCYCPALSVFFSFTSSIFGKNRASQANVLQNSHEKPVRTGRSLPTPSVFFIHKCKKPQPAFDSGYGFLHVLGRI